MAKATSRPVIRRAAGDEEKASSRKKQAERGRRYSPRRDPALAGRIRPRPRQHRRRLRGPRIPRGRSVAARRRHLARERKAPGADLQPDAAVRAPDHRRHAACAPEHQGRAGRLRIGQGGRAHPRRADPLYREPLRRAGRLLSRRRPAGRGRHRPLARHQGVCRRHDVQSGASHRRDRGRHRGDLGPGRGAAEQGRREILLRAGRHVARRVQGEISRCGARRFRGQRQRGVVRMVRHGFRARRRILGEEAGEAPARADAGRAHRRRHGRERQGGALPRRGHAGRGARELQDLPLPDFVCGDPRRPGGMARPLYPDRALPRRGNPDRAQDQAARHHPLRQGCAARLQLRALDPDRDHRAAAEVAVHRHGRQFQGVPGVLESRQRQGVSRICPTSPTRETTARRRSACSRRCRRRA